MGEPFNRDTTEQQQKRLILGRFVECSFMRTPEEIRAYKAAWAMRKYNENIVESRVKQNVYKRAVYAAFPEEKRRASLNGSRERVKARTVFLRKSVLEKYGNCCSRCGFSDVRALHIDHVNGDGAQERRGNPGRSRRVSFLRRVLEDTTGAYQILCANCNYIKAHEEGAFRGARRYVLDA